MDYQTVTYVNDQQQTLINNEFIANSDYHWFWSDHILPREQQDPWVRQRLFVNDSDQITFHPWGKYVKKIKEGETQLLDNFLLFPMVYQSLQKSNRLYFPATVWYPAPWLSTGLHKLIVWELLGRKFDLPILWQTPKDTSVKNAVQLSTSRQLIDLIAPRLDTVDENTRIYFHIRNGLLVNLTTSVNWKNPWNLVKDQMRPVLTPIIHQMIVDTDDLTTTNDIRNLLLNICTIKTPESL